MAVVQTNLRIILRKRFFTMKGTYISHFSKGHYSKKMSHCNKGPRDVNKTAKTWNKNSLNAVANTEAIKLFRFDTFSS